MRSPSLSSDALGLLLRWAASAVTAAVRGGSPPLDEVSDDELHRAGGVFVTLRRAGELAGCIGVVESDSPLVQSVVRVARSAALDDHRFEPIVEQDLPRLEIEISVLSNPERTTAEDFEPGVDGLILYGPGTHGLLLPQVATEHELDRRGFLRALCRKSGLADHAWESPDVLLQKFTVQRVSAPWSQLSDEEETGPDER